MKIGKVTGLVVTNKGKVVPVLRVESLSGSLFVYPPTLLLLSLSDFPADWVYPPTLLLLSLSDFPAYWVYPPTLLLLSLSDFPADWVYPPTPLKGGYVADYFEYRNLNLIQIFKYLFICEPQYFYAEFLKFIGSSFIIFPSFRA